MMICDFPRLSSFEKKWGGRFFDANDGICEVGAWEIGEGFTCYGEGSSTPLRLCSLSFDSIT